MDNQRLAEMIREVHVAMLVTFPPDGRPCARPMATQGPEPDEFDGSLWFMTDSNSAKVGQLAQNPEVLVTYAAPQKHLFVAVNGTASVRHDPERARKLWSLTAQGWWPEGPDSQSFVLIEVQVTFAECWKGPSMPCFSFQLARALISGERINADAEHHVVAPHGSHCAES